MKLFNFCIHKYKLEKTTKILTINDYGYPLMLCIYKCKHCGKIKEIWVDVPISLLNDKSYQIVDYWKVNTKWKF